MCMRARYSIGNTLASVGHTDTAHSMRVYNGIYMRSRTTKQQYRKRAVLNADFKRTANSSKAKG
jgi:predicted metallo-beta-lactamase superfamily hydrolase